jgi:thiamine biosynthesis lipoprotein
VTDGDVDPTVGRAMRVAGYDVDFAAVAADGPLVVTATPVPGWQGVRLNRVTRSVVVPQGVEIDLGATAKALAAGLAALDDGDGILVSLGGDIALAGVASGDGWVIQVSDDSTDPFDPSGESILLRGGAVASSSTRVRRWRRGGVEVHHILDPRTGLPVESPWRPPSVVADTCVDANIASTAAIVRGHPAVDWPESLGLPARLVGVDGAVVRTSRWPAPDDGA